MQSPQVDQRGLVDRTVRERDQLDAPRSQLQHRPDRLRGVVPEVGEALNDHEGEAARLLAEVPQQLDQAGAFATGRRVRIEKRRGRLVAMTLAVLEELRVLLDQRGERIQPAHRRRLAVLVVSGQAVVRLTEIADSAHNVMLWRSPEEY